MVVGEVGSVQINGWPIHYEKFGHGPEVILMIPGAIGTARTDFKPQIEGDYAFDHDEYTLICIELAGWGRSRPPERKYNKFVYFNDANCCLKLMEALGYKTYSVIGWSEGAKVALILGYRAPSIIKCVIVVALFLIISTETVAPLLKTRDTKTWPKEMRETFEQLYGDEFQVLWDKYIDFCSIFLNDFPRGCWTNELQNIRCPFLIFQGDLDPLITVEHALHAEKMIPYSQLHRFARGNHNCHQKYPTEFLRITENFLKQAAHYR